MATQQPSQPIPIHNNDADELKRLRINHEAFKASYENLVLAPIDLSGPTVHRILDSACSDGTWLRDVQAIHPAHIFTGTDIDDSILPANDKGISYQVQNINTPWPTDFTSHFSFVHQRLVLAAAGPLLRASIKSLVSLVEPGGWIQLEEMEVRKQITLPGISGELGRLIKGVFEKLGMEWDFASELELMLKQEGLEDVKVKDMVVGFGAKAEGDEGLKERTAEAWTIGVARLVGVHKTLGSKEFTEEELAAIANNTEKGMEEVGSDYVMHVVWARKPL